VRSGIERRQITVFGKRQPVQHEALGDSGGQQLWMLAKDGRQMLAEALWIGHASGVVLFTIERHTDTLASGGFHGSISPYGDVCSMHSRGREVESSYGFHRFFTNHEIRWNQWDFIGPQPQTYVNAQLSRRTEKSVMYDLAVGQDTGGRNYTPAGLATLEAR